MLQTFLPCQTIENDKNEIIVHEQTTADMEVFFYWNLFTSYCPNIKSFIYLSNMSLTNITCFSIHAQNLAKSIWLFLYSFAISCKKKIYFEKMRNFVQTWFRNDTKIMRNFVQNSHFVQKCCARESTASWKPYS